MATWIDELGDEAKSDWGKAKRAVQQVRNYFVDKVTSLKPKLGISVGVDIDAAIRIILDDSFLKVIDRISFALDNAIDKVGAEFQQLVKQLFSELSALADRINQTIDKVFKNISTALVDIKKNLIDPIVTAIADLETKLIKDINQVLDKVFDFFQGTAQDFKDDISKGTSLLIPNPFDPCRRETGTSTTPGPRLTSADVFNLFECNQLKRLEDSSTTVKEITEVYAVLQLQSFRVTCLGRGSTAFQDIYTKKWIKYGQLYDLWKEFNETMTAQQAFDEAIRRLDQARAEYQAKVNDINLAQQTADEAVKRADGAQNTANQANLKADAAQVAANGAVKNIDFYSIEAAVDTTVQSNDVVFNFPDSVDAVVLQTISNDHNQIVRANLSQLNPTSFKVHIDGVNGNGHRWIPGLKFLGIKLRR
jgi:hypothetical protein